MSDMIDKLSGGQILGMIAIVSGAVYLIIDGVAKQWGRVRRVEVESALKKDLLAAGQSAEEIERVVRASTGKSRPACD